MHRYTARTCACVCAHTRARRGRGWSVRRLGRVRKSREPHTLVEHYFFLPFFFIVLPVVLEPLFPASERPDPLKIGGGGRYPSRLDGDLFVVPFIREPLSVRFLWIIFFLFKRNFVFGEEEFLKIFEIFRGFISFVTNEIFLFFFFSNWIVLFSYDSSCHWN